MLALFIKEPLEIILILSNFSSVVCDIHMSFPLVAAVKFVNKLSLEKITGVDGVSLGVENCWHLKKEHLIWGLLSFCQFVSGNIE